MVSCSFRVKVYSITQGCWLRKHLKCKGNKHIPSKIRNLILSLGAKKTNSCFSRAVRYKTSIDQIVVLYIYYYTRENKYSKFINEFVKNKECISKIPESSYSEYSIALLIASLKTDNFEAFDIISEEMVDNESFIQSVEIKFKDDYESMQKIIQGMKNRKTEVWVNKALIESKCSLVSNSHTGNSLSDEEQRALLKEQKSNKSIINSCRTKIKSIRVISTIGIVLSFVLGFAIFYLSAIPFAFELYFLGIIMMIGGAIAGFVIGSLLKEKIGDERDYKIGDIEREISSLERKNSIIDKMLFLGIRFNEKYFEERTKQ